MRATASGADARILGRGDLSGSLMMAGLVLRFANHITDAAFGLDQRRHLALAAFAIVDLDAIDLLAQIRDIRFDDCGVTAPVVLPDMV